MFLKLSKEEKTPRSVNFIIITSVWNMRPKLHQMNDKSTSIVIWDLLIIQVDATACRHAMKLLTIMKVLTMILHLIRYPRLDIICKNILESTYGIRYKKFFDSFRMLDEVKINFKANEFLTIRRSERFGFIDFISNCGGLMGLFLGVSLFSVFEMVYFCVFQMFYRLCHREEIR
jgi:hypothetical protein